MTTNTQINITAKDSTAGAFASANNNLSGLASSALKTTAGLAGIGLSIAGAVEAVKGISQATIQFQKFNSTLLVGTGSAQGAADALSFVRSESQRLGLDLATAAEQFGKLTAASKGSALEGKATRDIFSSMSEAAAVLGLSADETRGALNAFQQMISKGKVQAEELRGQLGERLPGAFQLAARAMGVTTAELDKLLVAGKVTAEDLLPKLAVELNKTFGAQAEKSAQGLAGQMNRMNTAIFDLKIAIGESGLINFLSSGIELATKLAGALTSAFGGGQKLSPIEKQVSLIKTLEEELESLQNLTNIPLIGDLLFDKKQADLLKFRIESATEDLGKMKASFAADAVTETVISKAASQTEALSVATKRTISDAERFITALRKEAETVGLTAVEMKRLEAAKLGVSAAANPLISRIEKVTSEMDEQKESARALADDMRKIAAITESVKTSEEKLIDTQTELDRLMKSGLGIETYNRALKKAQDETRGVTVATKSTTDEVGQLWIQAGRNIQSTLANSIFNFFDDGLKGMVKNVGIAVARIASEFAALKIAQGLGIGAIFGGASSAAIAGGGAVAGGGGSGSILSGALSLGSNALSFLGGGGKLLGSAASALGFGAFGSGASGAATAGVFGAGGASYLGGAGTALGAGAEFGTAATLGASMASAMAIAGPLIAVDIAGRLLAGDKKLGGAEMIPVVGGILAALFGHGPYKFRQQSLQGEVSSEGFDGNIANVFRSKGGLFSKNKHKTVIEQLSADQQLAFDTAITGFYDSAHNFAENLGLPTELVDNFTTQIQIKSNKGGKLKEEVITEMLSGIADSLAKSVLPSIADLAKVGERAFETFTRLNTEFSGLAAGAVNLGASIEYAKELIKGMSFAARDDLIAMAGGLENLASLTSYFNQNFLTQQEQLAPVVEGLSAGLKKLGIASDITKEQFKAMVQDVNLSNETRIELLRLAPALLAVRSATSQATAAAETYTSVVNVRDVNDTEQGQRLNASINETAQAIAELEGIASQLAGTVNSINPLTTNQARAIVAKGDPYDPNLQNALSILSTSDNNDFGSKLDLQRSKALNIGAINSLQNSVASNISAKESQQAQYEFEKQMLQISLQNAAVMFSTLEQAAKTAEILDKVTAGGGAMLVEMV